MAGQLRLFLGLSLLFVPTVVFGLGEDCLQIRQNDTELNQEPKYLKCSKCHNGEPNVTGPDGNSHPVNQCRSIIPNLHGQPEDYLKRELYKFQVGQRKNSVMNSITRNLEHGDIETLAQWGAIKSSSIRDCNMPDLPKCNDLNFLETKKIVDECGAECHGRDFKNGLKKGCRNSENGPYCYPRIFGQKAQYLYKQLDDFRTGKRKSDVMNAMAKRIRDHSMLGKENYDPNMLSCIAEYLCTQNPN